MFLQSFIAFLVTVMVAYFARPLAIKIGLVDIPGGRKQHSKNTPLIGGVAMFSGLIFALILSSFSVDFFRPLLASMAILVFVGVLDDFHEVRPRAKLIAQLLAALIITFWGGAIVHSLGNLFFLGSVELGVFAIPFTIIAIIGVINAANMVDGVDGLSAGLALIQSLLILGVAVYLHAWLFSEFLTVFIAVISGFFVFNFHFPGRKRALIFMGDAGSMFIGLTLAYFAIQLSRLYDNQVSPVLFLWILSISLFDMGYVMARRLLKRVSIMQADRWHLHYLLLDAGLSVRSVAIIMPVVNLLIGLLGFYLFSHHVGDSWMFVGIWLIFILYSLFLTFGRCWFSSVN